MANGAAGERREPSPEIKAKAQDFLRFIKEQRAKKKNRSHHKIETTADAPIDPEVYGVQELDPDEIRAGRFPE